VSVFSVTNCDETEKTSQITTYGLLTVLFPSLISEEIQRKFCILDLMFNLLPDFIHYINIANAFTLLNHMKLVESYKYTIKKTVYKSSS